MFSNDTKSVKWLFIYFTYNTGEYILHDEGELIFKPTTSRQTNPETDRIGVWIEVEVVKAIVVLVYDMNII